MIRQERAEAAKKREEEKAGMHLFATANSMFWLSFPSTCSYCKPQTC
jgi:hypothetical protein